jgi:hypothetical protein
MSSISESIRQQLSFLDSPYVAAALSIGIVLYASIAAPRLPPSMARIFQNKIFRLLTIFLIAYVAVKNLSIAVTLTLAFVASTMAADRHSIRAQVHQYYDALPFVDHRNHIKDAPQQFLPQHIDFSGEGMPMGLEHVNSGEPIADDSEIRGFDGMSPLEGSAL